MEKREDLRGTNLTATFKPMPTGELRWRLRPQVPDLALFAMHLTKAPSVATWQEAHVHRGLLEHYLVLKGKVGFVMQTSPVEFEYGLRDFSDGVFSFLPGEVHNILPGPGAEFMTVQIHHGTAVPNITRNGEDWWPADERFTEQVRPFMDEVEKTF